MASLFWPILYMAILPACSSGVIQLLSPLKTAPNCENSCNNIRQLVRSRQSLSLIGCLTLSSPLYSVRDRVAWFVTSRGPSAKTQSWPSEGIKIPRAKLGPGSVKNVPCVRNRETDIQTHAETDIMLFECTKIHRIYAMLGGLTESKKIQ